MICRYESPEFHHGVAGDFKSHSPKQWFYELEDKDLKEAKELFLDEIKNTGEVPTETYLICPKNNEEVIVDAYEFLHLISDEEIADAVKYYIEKRS